MKCFEKIKTINILQNEEITNDVLSVLIPGVPRKLKVHIEMLLDIFFGVMIVCQECPSKKFFFNPKQL